MTPSLGRRPSSAALFERSPCLMFQRSCRLAYRPSFRLCWIKRAQSQLDSAGAEGSLPQTQSTRVPLDSPCSDLLAGVVRLVDVDQSPGPDPVQLKDRLALGLRVVVRPCRDQPERASGQRLHLRFVELLAHADHQCAANDGDLLPAWVEEPGHLA